MIVSIVIPNWNGVDKLRQNLPGVLKVKGVEEIIVSDDASTDDSVKLLKNEFPEIKLVEREKNGGFSANVNTGVNAASGDLLFLLNTDALPEPDCVEKVLTHFKDPKVFSVSMNTGGNWSWAKWKDGFFRHYQAEGKQQSHETMWASGGSGIFRKTIWIELGGFDPLYNPFYVEDLDLGYRAFKRGFINIWEKNAKVEHYKQKGVIAEHFSKQYVSTIAERNQLIFIWKNITDLSLISSHLLTLVRRLITHPKYWSIFLQALIHLPEILTKRAKAKKWYILTDKEILKKFN